MTTETIQWILLGLLLCSLGLTILLLAFVYRQGKRPVKIEDKALQQSLFLLREELQQESRHNRQEIHQAISQSVQSLSHSLSAGQGQLARELSSRQDSLQQSVIGLMTSIDNRFQHFAAQSEQQLLGVKTAVEQRLSSLQEDNAKQLDQMRLTVDEKLQKTLESRIGQSFQLVSDRLEQVHKGLGEMQTLAAGVGDLKKVLSNVKTRGILGEVQLGAILEQILAPEQYASNVVTKRGSRNPVEFAVVLPGDDHGTVYLPIDAKFPADAYTQLTDAYDVGDPAAIAAATALLTARIKSFAKDIRDKYIDPPATTDFAILFLPFEGLYAQVLQLGLLEVLQRDYKVNIAGPTTMAALLNSLQMGFQTLAIQKRSSEVWDVLGAVKTEFNRFGDVLGTAQQRLEQANKELDKLVGVRTRMIQRRLAQITALPEEAARIMMEESGDLLTKELE